MKRERKLFIMLNDMEDMSWIAKTTICIFLAFRLRTPEVSALLSKNSLSFRRTVAMPTFMS